MGTYAKGLGLVAVLLIGQTQLAFGQSKQYQRPKPQKQPTSSSVVMPDAKGSSSPSSDPSAAAGAPANSTDKKVDITDLEKKYWVPKDTEFQVVQNRTYTKAKKVALTASLGSLLSDPYSSAIAYGLTGSYYFSERHGVELSYINLNTKNTALTDEFLNTYAAVPDHNKIKYYIGAAYTWVPIYAKLSLLEKQIIYFDMSLTVGGGLTKYDQQYLTAPVTSKTAPTIAIDIAQHFFLNQHFALRADLKNRLFNEEVMNARNPNEVRRTKLNHTAIFMLGVSFFFN